MFDNFNQKIVDSHIMAIFMSYCPQFWGSRVIYNDPKTRYMSESYDQKLVVFHVLWPFSWAIAHFFGALGGFTAILRPDTCLTVMTKNSSFSCFMFIFTNYCPHFLGSWRIYLPQKNPYMFSEIWPGTRRFRVYGHFDELFPTVFGFLLDLQRL